MGGAYSECAAGVRAGRSGRSMPSHALSSSLQSGRGAVKAFLATPCRSVCTVLVVTWSTWATTQAARSAGASITATAQHAPEA
jgi:hypothetical protein